MAMTVRSPVKVGDTMLYVSRRGARPQEVAVQRVTPTGQVRVNLPGLGKSATFRPDRYFPERYEAPGRRGDVLWLRTEQTLVDLAAEADEAEREHARRDTEKREARAKRDAEWADQMAEVKRVIGESDLPLPLETLSNGSRVYLLRVPVKEELRKRKGNVEVALLCCKDDEELCLETGKSETSVRMSMASVNGHGSCMSLSEFSGNVADDKAALWDAICSLYHRAY